MRLLVATGNPHKLEEFRRIFQPLGIEALSPEQAGCSLDVEENGTTFMQNARIKAQFLHRQSGLGVVADDSGLCVDALGGRPGVYSARYAGADTPHSEKIQFLLEELASVPDGKRTARFVAAICCLPAKGEAPLECEGICEGSIAHAPVGSDGFGFDPIFLVDGQSFAELSPQQKDEYSHRGRALRLLATKLKTWMNTREAMHDYR